MASIPTFSQIAGFGGMQGKWMAADCHQHSYYTDEGHILDEVIVNGFKYGLDFQANSEHGAPGAKMDIIINRITHHNYPVNPIKGIYEEKDDHRVMWRWQSLSEYTPSTPEETDSQGSSLLDFKQTKLDGENEAWHDLCFYLYIVIFFYSFRGDK